MGEAARLGAGGASGLAAGIEEIALDMRSQLDRELTRARRRSETAASADPAEIAKAVAAVLGALRPERCWTSPRTALRD